MICDIVFLSKFRYYKSQKGPFIFTFYEESSDRKNFELYSYLKSIEEEYNDLPIIRFNYHDFINKFPEFNVPSPNHLMVIEKNEKTQFYDTTQKYTIPNILLNVRQKILLHKRINSKIFRKRNLSKLTPFIINSSKYRVEEISKYLKMSADDQYKFPNNTTFYHRNELRQKREKTIECSQKPSLNKLCLYPQNKGITNSKNSIRKAKFNTSKSKYIFELPKTLEFQQNNKHSKDLDSKVNNNNEIQFVIENKLNNKLVHSKLLNPKRLSHESFSKSIQLNKILTPIIRSGTHNQKFSTNSFHNIDKSNLKQKNRSYLKLRKDISDKMKKIPNLSMDMIYNDSVKTLNFYSIKSKTDSDTSTAKSDNEPLDLSINTKEC